MRGPLWEPVELEPDPEYVLVQADGTIRDHHNHIMSEAMAGQIREGYRCIQCLEPFEVPWPENCSACRYPVAEKQAERFGREFRGSVRVGPSTSIDDELALAEELVAQQRLRKEGLKRTRPGIVVPRWADA